MEITGFTYLKTLLVYFYFSSFCKYWFLFYLRYPSTSGKIRIGRTKMQREEHNDLEFQVILREIFFRFFYALINISRTKPGMLHSDFTMKFRIKIKQDMIKGNFLLCRNKKGPPQKEPGENRKELIAWISQRQGPHLPSASVNDSCSKAWSLKSEKLG